MDVYVDFLSPYAYLAWCRARSLLAGARLRPCVVLLGPLLQHHGQLGPAEIPAKRVFMIRDTLRRAAEAGIPLVWPERHPFKPVLPARAVHALADADRPRAVDALFDAAWRDGRDLEDAEVVRTALAGAGLDAEAVLARAAGAETSASLRASVQAAIERGVFGVPTVIDDDGELFFGDDQLERIARKRAGQDPLDAAAREEAARVAARPVAVQRAARREA